MARLVTSARAAIWLSSLRSAEKEYRRRSNACPLLDAPRRAAGQGRLISMGPSVDGMDGESGGVRGSGPKD